MVCGRAQRGGFNSRADDLSRGLTVQEQPGRPRRAARRLGPELPDAAYTLPKGWWLMGHPLSLSGRSPVDPGTNGELPDLQHHPGAP